MTVTLNPNHLWGKKKIANPPPVGRLMFGSEKYIFSVFYLIFVVLMKRLLVLNSEAFLLTVFTVFNIRCTNESTL